jgi:YidC/Oxa1 family membrane protein insertase
MEEKKIDINSVIGYVLIFGIILYMFWQNQPTPEQIAEQEKAKQEQVEAEKKVENNPNQGEPFVTSSEDFSNASTTDSTQLEGLKNKLGAFAYASTLPSATDKETLVETDLLSLKFNNKGGYLSEVKLKKYVDYDSIPIYLIKDGNSVFNLNFATTDNRILNTQDLFFQPTITKNGENTLVSMKLKVSETKFLEYRYELKPNDYMLGFTVRSQGLNDVVNSSQKVNLDWKLKTFRHDKSISYENRYTRLTYQTEGDKIDKLSPTGEDEETESDLDWISYRQHFFSSILVADEPFKDVVLKSEDLVLNEEIDSVYTKIYQTKLPVNVNTGEFDNNLRFYFGPTDNKILKKYDIGLDHSLPFGWGIFGWINRYVFVPLFAWLSSFLPYGIAIILMTVLIKLVLSFAQYKQFLSQAKLKILKPELDAIREKYKDNKLKVQQETMSLQTKAGASPMAGCLPALIQLPVFYALFQFFPSALDLRQNSFRWAEDLSSYDVIAQLPFHIPFYGEHVSLFPILASVAIFFYMKMTTGQQMASQPTQEGMPDMGKIMKVMIYLSPIMMLFFFNNYASGLSLYYFISNVISIGIMIVIKNYILDEDKIHAQMQVQKAKPKKQSRFQQKMQEMMEKAEEQKKLQQKRKK